MRTQVKALCLILVALLMVVLMMRQYAGLGAYQMNQSRLPHTLGQSEISVTPVNTRVVTKNASSTSNLTSLTGQNTFKRNLSLDGSLGGYNLEAVRHILGKPCAQWYYPFLLAGWSPSEWATARWVIYRESRCLQYAFNGHDAGLMQINQIHKGRVSDYGLRFPEDLFDGETNLWVAYMMWLDYGWEPWEHKGVVPG